MMRILKSFGHAFRGLRAAWHDGWNFRIHILVAVAVISFISYVHLPFIDTAFLVLAIAAVIFAELMNTALERTLDIIEANHHPEIGRIKDIAAGAVLVATLGALAVGVIVFLRNFPLGGI